MQVSLITAVITAFLAITVIAAAPYKMTDVCNMNLDSEGTTYDGYLLYSSCYSHNSGLYEHTATDINGCVGNANGKLVLQWGGNFMDSCDGAGGQYSCFLVHNGNPINEIGIECNQCPDNAGYLVEFPSIDLTHYLSVDDLGDLQCNPDIYIA